MISERYFKTGKTWVIVLSMALSLSSCQKDSSENYGVDLRHKVVPEGFYSEVIPYSIFVKNFNDRIKYENILSKGKPLNKNKVAQFYVQSWNDLYIQALLKPEVDYLGLTVSQNEIDDMIFGNNPHQSIRNLPFLNDEKGVFQPRLAKEFVQRIQKDTAGDPSLTWDVFVREMVNKHQSDKHQNIFSAAFFVTPAEEKYYDYYQSTEIDFDYAFKSYATTNIEITHDSLLVNLYQQYENDYFKPESRKVAYITAKPIIDSANHLEELKRFSALKNHTASDYKTLAEKSQAIKFFSTEYNLSNTQGNLLNFFGKGKINDVYGPVFQNNSYRLTKIIDKYERPDSVKIRHILLIDKDTLLVAKLMKEISEKKNFSEIAAKYSADPNNKDNGGEIGWVRYGEMGEPFNTACFSAPNDFYFEIGSGYGKHLVHIMEISATSTQYVFADVLFMELEPNERDFKNLEKITNRISRKSKSGEDLFAEAIKYGFATTNATLQNTFYTIPEIDDSYEMVQWCFKNGKNKVSPPFKKGNNVYIISISDIIPTGNLPFYEVRDIVHDDFVMLYRKDTLYDRLKPLINDSKSLEENAKVLGSNVIGIKKMILASYDIPSLGVENELRGLLMGMKVGQTSSLFKGDKGLFIVRKTAERKIKSSSTPQTRLTNQYLADVQNDIHLADISTEAKAFMNFVRQQDSYLLLKTYKNFLPDDNKAAVDMIQAEYAFRGGKWDLALQGSARFKGLKSFYENTNKDTKQSRLAKLYSGICFLKLKDYTSAINVLATIEPTEDYYTSSLIPILMGDAFSFLNNPKKALEYYKLALEKGNSRFYAGITLHKLALHHYREGNFNEAKEACRELLKKNVGHHHGQVLSELLKMMETRNNE